MRTFNICFSFFGEKIPASIFGGGNAIGDGLTKVKFRESYDKLSAILHGLNNSVQPESTFFLMNIFPFFKLK